jgi:hypothetical protein
MNGEMRLTTRQGRQQRDDLEEVALAEAVEHAVRVQLGLPVFPVVAEVEVLGCVRCREQLEDREGDTAGLTYSKT